MPYFQACSPCGIDYQFISKQESSLADAQVRIILNFKSENLRFPLVLTFMKYLNNSFGSDNQSNLFSSFYRKPILLQFLTFLADMKIHC